MQMKKTRKILSLLLALIMIGFTLTFYVDAAASKTVCIGGMPFGVRFKTEGVTVAELEDIDTGVGSACPAKDAGLEPGDVIVKLDENEIGGAEDIINRITSGGGSTLTVVYKRRGEEKQTSLTPVRDRNGIYRAGMWIRDSAAGIGTITYYDAKTGAFAGLGHGICDAETGELIPLSHGDVTDVSLCGINKGKSGAPGELKGFFGETRIGEISSNKRTGVYGTLNKLPKTECEYVEVAKRNEVKEGEATIRCTLADGETRDYTAQISEIDVKSGECKNFIVIVTDPELLAKTGGIVQGMSGSPILQNGKLIGAVTHVMVNDPTRGYGIFIENMLEAAG